MAGPQTRRLALPDRYDFTGTVSQLPMGGHDPCLRIAAGAFWWATRTPDGPATLSLRRDGAELIATGYGPGRDWVLAQADGVAGLRDDPSGFAEAAAGHPVIKELARRHAGLRLPAIGRVFQPLIRTIFEQKVTGKEAYRSYAGTVRHFHAAAGREPAPGPLPLLLPPDPAAVAAALEACPDAASATARLVAVPGIGAWTAAEVVRVAYGDPDAVSVGDYHIPHLVSWNLVGEARAGAREGAPGRLSPADERMLELLEPFRGHRGRVCVLLELGGQGAPRFGPRMPIRSLAAY